MDASPRRTTPFAATALEFLEWEASSRSQRWLPRRCRASLMILTFAQRYGTPGSPETLIATVMPYPRGVLIG